MAYSPELIARIKRLHFYEHYTIHAVSKTVGLHRDTVKRILYQGKTQTAETMRVSLIEPYRECIEDHLKRYPKITGTQLFSILKDRGYKGSIGTVRRAIKPLRVSKATAYKPMHFPPGFQAQVDWAHFPAIKMVGGERKLYLFVMVLSWSRTMFARFTFDQKTDSFLRMHEQAFEYFGGSPKELLYDNLKSAVLQRYKDNVQFNPQLLELSALYGFDPQATKPYSGNQKGRVERAIRYVRDNFALTASFNDLETLNTQLRKWLDQIANRRLWPENKDFTVADQLKKERPLLYSLPAKRLAPKQRITTKSNKCSLIRFDANDYSIPWQYARKQVSIEADDFEVKFFNEADLICSHQRSWHKGQKIIRKEHWKKGDHDNSYQIDYLAMKYPAIGKFYETLIKRGETYQKIQRHFSELEALYDPSLFKIALNIAEKSQKFHPLQLGEILAKLNKNSKKKIKGQLSHLNEEIRDLSIKSHSLDTYDLF